VLHGQSVDAVLARMDKAAPSFHAMSANIAMATYTAIISDTITETGTLRMQRLKGQDVRAELDFSGQRDAREIGFFGKIVRIYYPKLNTVQDYDVGKNLDVLNQFLLLGFGSSGHDLAASYTITSPGEEKLAGQNTTKLVLVPKNMEVAKRLSRIEMWIPNDAAYPIQQKFLEPSGNYRIVTYSDINLKPSIKGRLELKLPPNVKKQTS
jgi:outer membrane lipoprotein-sorting protein